MSVTGLCGHVDYYFFHPQCFLLLFSPKLFLFIPAFSKEPRLLGTVLYPGLTEWRCKSVRVMRRVLELGGKDSIYFYIECVFQCVTQIQLNFKFVSISNTVLLFRLIVASNPECSKNITIFGHWRIFWSFQLGMTGEILITYLCSELGEETVPQVCFGIWPVIPASIQFSSPITWTRRATSWLHGSPFKRWLFCNCQSLSSSAGEPWRVKLT